MKKEHFIHICEAFPMLLDYARNNDQWYNDVEIKDIHVYYSETYFIERSYQEKYIFGYIPTKELAEKILQYIKDTEMLFI